MLGYHEEESSLKSKQRQIEPPEEIRPRQSRKCTYDKWVMNTENRSDQSSQITEKIEIDEDQTAPLLRAMPPPPRDSKPTCSRGWRNTLISTMLRIWFKALFKVREKIFASLNSPNHNLLFRLILPSNIVFQMLGAMTWKSENLYLRVLMSASICLDLWMSEDHDNRELDINNL